MSTQLKWKQVDAGTAAAAKRLEKLVMKTIVAEATELQQEVTLAGAPSIWLFSDRLARSALLPDEKELLRERGCWHTFSDKSAAAAAVAASQKKARTTTTTMTTRGRQALACRS